MATVDRTDYNVDYNVVTTFLLHVSMFPASPTNRRPSCVYCTLGTIALAMMCTSPPNSEVSNDTKGTMPWNSHIDSLTSHDDSSPLNTIHKFITAIIGELYSVLAQGWLNVGSVLAHSMLTQFHYGMAP